MQASNFIWAHSNSRLLFAVHPVDGAVVDYLRDLVDFISGAIVRFVVVIVMTPIFSLPGILLCVIGVLMGQVWMRTQLAVKRERSNARSRILGHVGAAIAGLGESIALFLLSIKPTLYSH